MTAIEDEADTAHDASTAEFDPKGSLQIYRSFRVLIEACDHFCTLISGLSMGFAQVARQSKVVRQCSMRLRM